MKPDLKYKVSEPKPTPAYNAIIITAIISVILLVVFYSGKGDGESERERSLRVILQCWKTADMNQPWNGVSGQIQKCEQMERAFRKAHGSSLG